MKIFIGADHAGFGLKEKLVDYLRELDFEVEDKGAFELNEGDDYTDFVAPVAEAVSEGTEDTRGIILGGSGQGEAMLANRFNGVRTAIYYGGDLEMVRLSRDHNNANVLSLAARFLTEEEAKEEQVGNGERFQATDCSRLNGLSSVC